MLAVLYIDLNKSREVKGIQRGNSLRNRDSWNLDSLQSAQLSLSGPIFFFL